jgi:predicted MPP superfamily phosphohydrolase
MTTATLRSDLRSLLLRDIWRNVALVLGAVQVQILAWARYLLGGEPLGGWWVLGLSSVAMLANAFLVPLIRSAGRGGGGRRLAARLYMNVGIGTLLIGIAVGGSWMFLYPAGSLVALLGAPNAGDLFFRTTSGVLVAAVALSFVWGATIGQWGYGRSFTKINVPGLHVSHRGLRILQLSDLHIGNGLEDRRLDDLVAQVNGLSPDLIAITGDIFDNDPSFVDAGARGLARLEARLGVFVVLGNHDAYTGLEKVADALAQHAPHFELLRGRIARVPGEGPLYLAGVDDPGRDWTARDLQMSEIETLAAARPKDGPTILLVHRPEVFHQVARLGYPLMLAGHTHGGQIALPMFGGRVNPARVVSSYTRGVYRIGDSTLYVNRGAGMAGPRIRFGCSREIAIIELSDEDGNEDAA